MIMAIFVCAPLIASDTESLEDAAAVLSGKTVKLIIAGSAGGSHDTYGRTLVDFLKIRLPDTRFLVQNNRKAGGFLAAQDVQEAGGELVTIGLFQPSLVYSQMLDQQEGAFDLRDWKWIASLSFDQRLYMARKDFPDPTIEGVRAYPKQILAGTSAAGARSDVDLLLLNALAGINGKIVYGFRSSAQRKAIIAGELDYIIGSLASSKRYIDSGDFVPFLRISVGEFPDGIGDIPSLSDVALPGAPQKIIELMKAVDGTGRVLAAGPNVPDEIVDALRTFVAFAFSLPDYRSENEKKGLSIRFTSGVDVGANIQAFLNDQSTIAVFRKAVECGREISDGKLARCDFASW